MALIMCRKCKKAFFNSPQEEEICPSCMTRLKELYPIVRGFLRNNEKKSYTVLDVSKIMGIPLEDVEGMVSVGLFEYQASETQAPQKVKNKNTKEQA